MADRPRFHDSPYFSVRQVGIASVVNYYGQRKTMEKLNKQRNSIIVDSLTVKLNEDNSGFYANEML